MIGTRISVIALKFLKLDSNEFSRRFQISSVTSMSFLTDPNLTFHRFSDGTISSDGRKVMRNESQVWTTGAALDYSTTNPTLAANDSATSRTKILANEDDEVSKRYSTYSSTGNNSTVNAINTGSTMKLIQVQRKDSANDSSSKQVSADLEATTLLTLDGKALSSAAESGSSR